MLLSLFVSIAGASYAEHLKLTNFKDGKVMATFEHTTISTLSSHYDIFPKALGEIFRAFDVQELHLTLTRGRWRYDRWGYGNTAPNGVSLHTWLPPLKYPCLTQH
jgi:phosphatidylinositol glycan class T